MWMLVALLYVRPRTPHRQHPQVAERRFNQVLFARLRPKGASTDLPNGGTFCIGTYHMPCLFNNRPVMVMHTSMAIKHLAKLAGSDPLVFAGDFNFNPDSDCYKLAVEGENAPAPPPPQPTAPLRRAEIKGARSP